jgi:hypothetical protein
MKERPSSQKQRSKRSKRKERDNSENTKGKNERRRSLRNKIRREGASREANPLQGSNPNSDVETEPLRRRHRKGKSRMGSGTGTATPPNHEKELAFLGRNVAADAKCNCSFNAPSVLRAENEETDTEGTSAGRGEAVGSGSFSKRCLSKRVLAHFFSEGLFEGPFGNGKPWSGQGLFWRRLAPL